MDYTETYDPDLDFDAVYTRATGTAIAHWVRPADRLLELGCATGLMTTAFAAAGARITAVEKSAGYLERLAARELPHVTALHRDLELEGWPEVGGFDHVVATSLIHELTDPAAFLREAAARLAPGGALHVSVPNPRSLHRLVALEMGWIEDLHALSDRQHQYETLRMMGRADIEAHAVAAGLRIAHHEGVVVKPLPNAQMAALPPEVLEGFVRAARQVPELCAMDLYLLRRA